MSFVSCVLSLAVSGPFVTVLFAFTEEIDDDDDLLSCCRESAISATNKKSVELVDDRLPCYLGEGFDTQPRT